LAARVICLNCGRAYPDQGVPYCCPVCGGLYDMASPEGNLPIEADGSQPGIWCYRSTFGFPPSLQPVSLGEGGTPLVWAKVSGRRVAFKDETRNPTGSFKDRGSSLIVAWLRSRSVREAVEDSSGNAGASFAAYAARAGMRARVFVPQTASAPKLRQIESFGAELVLVPGPRSQVAEAVLSEAQAGAAYASHACLPFNLPGYATLAYELFEQLGGRLPGAVLLPVGQGGLLLGLWRGFERLRAATQTQEAPRLIGVQARACAPLWALFTNGPDGLRFVAENPTLAEGVRVRYPLRGDAVLEAVRHSRGLLEAVDEAEIPAGRKALSRLGLNVEPTSAIVWPVLQRLLPDLPDTVVVVLTGSGDKFEPLH
jgi:threonine synthase